MGWQPALGYGASGMGIRGWGCRRGRLKNEIDLKLLLTLGQHCFAVLLDRQLTSARAKYLVQAHYSTALGECSILSWGQSVIEHRDEITPCGRKKAGTCGEHAPALYLTRDGWTRRAVSRTVESSDYSRVSELKRWRAPDQRHLSRDPRVAESEKEDGFLTKHQTEV